MPPYEQKDNSGGLFKNERKESDSHPNMTGTAKIDGVEYYVSGWTKEGKKGKWISLAFKLKNEVIKNGLRRSPPPDSDEIPF